MKISYNWLKELLPLELSPHQVADLLTNLGMAVDEVVRVGPSWKGDVVTGKILRLNPVPGSDHLMVCEVGIGEGREVMVVCGAPNVEAGLTVPVVLAPCELPNGMMVTPRIIKGIQSEAVIPSLKELGLGDDHTGIMTLPSDIALGYNLSELIGEDWIFEVDVTFNRPDCMSHWGVARELAAKLGLSLPSLVGEAEVKAWEDILEEVESQIKVRIEDPEGCPRYVARLVKGVKVGPSPLWLQQRLRWLGMRPINNVVDITNYLLLELGHPLHAFDAQKIEGRTIVVRRSNPGEILTTLDGKVRELLKEDLVIADLKRGLALAGVMGGLESEISDDTREVLIESAYFNPLSIWSTARFHQLHTESSRRFERGADPEMAPVASAKAALMIAQMTGGRIVKGSIDCYRPDPQVRTIPLRWHRVISLTGLDISPDVGVKILNRLGFTVSETIDGGDKFLFSVPSWRRDITGEEDLIEEVARVYGYDQVPIARLSRLPLFSQSRARRDYEIVKEIKQVLAGEGFREAQTWSLISSREAAPFLDENRLVKISNPISEELSVLRPTLLPGLLRAVRKNLSAGVENIRLFEWGKVFTLKGGGEGKDDERVEERWMLGGVMVGENHPSEWLDKSRLVGFWDLKGVVERMLSCFHLDKGEWKYYLENGWLERVGEWWGDEGDKVLVLGKVKRDWAERWEVEKEVWYMEWNGEFLLKKGGLRPLYKPLPRFPAVERDLAFIVRDTLPAQELEETIRAGGGDLLESVRLFDLYQGEGIPSGFKSLAYHLTFRSRERTLRDEEVDELVGVIIERVRKDRGGVLRGEGIGGKV